MTKDEITRIALECGFTLREQPDGAMDLNPYVYDFAGRLITAEREACAKVCESWDTAITDKIAADIRARSTQ